MQRVIRERPYPGRGPLSAPAQIELEDLPCSRTKDKAAATVIADCYGKGDVVVADDADRDSDGSSSTVHTIPLRDVSLATQAQR